jgi:hypothetical protein
MNFGQALESIKEGKIAFREGWNGKGMYISLNKGSSAELAHIGDFTEQSQLIEGIKKELFELGDIGTVNRLPNINIRTVSGSTVTGWVPSQGDLLSEDWVVS